MTHEQYLDMLKWLDERISLVIKDQHYPSAEGARGLQENEDAGRSIFVTSPDDEEG